VEISLTSLGIRHSPKSDFAAVTVSNGPILNEILHSEMCYFQSNYNANVFRAKKEFKVKK